MEIKFFDDSIEEFISSLEKFTILKVFRTIDLLEQFGHRLGMPHSKRLTQNIFELRIRGIQEVRLLYTFYDGRAMILYGFIKKSEKLPTRHLKTAVTRRRALDDR